MDCWPSPTTEAMDTPSQIPLMIDLRNKKKCCRTGPLHAVNLGRKTCPCYLQGRSNSKVYRKYQ